jgi:hypothetical protein
LDDVLADGDFAGELDADLDAEGSSADFMVSHQVS